MTVLRFVDVVFNPSVVERLCWVLLHSVWQFLALALLAAVALRMLMRFSAAARYGVLVVALAGVAVLPIATWYWLSNDVVPIPVRHDLTIVPNPFAVAEADSPVSAAASELGETVPDRAGGPAKLPKPNGESAAAPAAELPPIAVPWQLRWESAIRPWLSWVVAVWTIGVFFCSLRPLLGWRTIRRLKRVGTSPVPSDVLDVLVRVSVKLGMRRTVAVLRSTVARTPMLVGYLRPVIPFHLASNMPWSKPQSNRRTLALTV